MSLREAGSGQSLRFAVLEVVSRGLRQRREDVRKSGEDASHFFKGQNLKLEANIVGSKILQLSEWKSLVLGIVCRGRRPGSTSHVVALRRPNRNTNIEEPRIRLQGVFQRFT